MLGLGAGCLDIVNTHGKSSRIQGLEFMVKSERGDHLDLPLVRYTKVPPTPLHHLSPRSSQPPRAPRCIPRGGGTGILRRQGHRCVNLTTPSGVVLLVSIESGMFHQGNHQCMFWSRACKHQPQVKGTQPVISASRAYRFRVCPELTPFCQHR